MSDISDHIEVIKKGDCKDCGHVKFNHYIKEKICRPVVRGIALEKDRPNGWPIGLGLVCVSDIINCDCKGYKP